MRVLQISPYFLPYTGGSEHYCHEISKRLVKNGHEVDVYTSRIHYNLPKNEVIDGINVTRFFCPGIIGNVNPITIVLNKLLKEEFDIVHSHSYIFLTSNQAALARKINGTPLIVHLHGGLDTAITTDNLFSRLLFDFKERFYDPTVGKWTLEAADVVASVSKQDILLAKILLSNKPIYTQLANGVDVNSFYKSERVDEITRIAYIGRLESWKGIEVFLQTMKILDKMYTDLEFIIVGDGTLRNTVTKVIPKIRNKVTYHGFVPHQRVPGILSNVDINIIPSFTEGMPTVCLEAFASRIPVVCSKVGGLPELVSQGETGLLMNPGDVNTCVKNVSTLISNRDMRNTMGEACRKLVEDNYSWDIILKKTELLYTKILGA